MDRELIVVTGASGLIGSAVVKRLAGGFRVAGLDRQEPPHPPPEAESISVDLTSDQSVKQAFKRIRQMGSRIASVIHLAAYYDFSGNPSPMYETVTVEGTARLLEALKGFTVEQFVFSSTLLVHKPCRPGEKITEDWPLEAKWDYPKSKLKTESLIKARHDRVPIVLLRIAGVYDDQCHSIPLANQIQRIHERKITSYFYPGNPETGQSFLHLDDLVEAFAALIPLRRQLPPSLTLLLGEPETYGYDVLQQEFGRLIHQEKWKTFEIAKPLAKTGAWIQTKAPALGDPFIKPWMVDLADDHYALDITRAKKHLGWYPKNSLIATLPKMVAGLKSDPAAWYRENHLKVPATNDKDWHKAAA